MYLCKKWCEGSGEKKQRDLWAVKMRAVTEIIRKFVNRKSWYERISYVCNIY